MQISENSGSGSSQSTSHVLNEKEIFLVDDIKRLNSQLASSARKYLSFT